MTKEITKYLDALKRVWPYLSKAQRKKELTILKRTKKRIEKIHPEWKK